MFFVRYGLKPDKIENITIFAKPKKGQKEPIGIRISKKENIERYCEYLDLRLESKVCAMKPHKYFLTFEMKDGQKHVSDSF